MCMWSYGVVKIILNLKTFDAMIFNTFKIAWGKEKVNELRNYNQNKKRLRFNLYIQGWNNFNQIIWIW